MRDKIVANFRCYNDFVPLFWKRFRYQFFTQPVSVSVGGVEKGHTEVERLVHEGNGFALGEIAPPACRNCPKTESDFADGKLRVFVGPIAH